MILLVCGGEDGQGNESAAMVDGIGGGALGMSLHHPRIRPPATMAVKM